MRGWAASTPSLVVDGLACDVVRTSLHPQRTSFHQNLTPILSLLHYVIGASFLSPSLFCSPLRLPEPKATATISQTKTTMCVVERDMRNHYNTGNEKYRATVEHRAIGWELSALIPNGNAGGEQSCSPTYKQSSFRGHRGRDALY